MIIGIASKTKPFGRRAETERESSLPTTRTGRDASGDVFGGWGPKI